MSALRLVHNAALLRLAALAAILLAACVRLWHLDLTVFESDQAGMIHVAEDLVVLKKVPLSGPMSSVGLATPAHFLYLLAPFVAVSRDPAFVSACLAALNVAGIAATIWLGWRAFGPAAGLAAGLLFAVNPWAVTYSRLIWQPDVLAPLAALLLVALDLGVIGKKAWWAAASLPIVAFGSLVHTSFVLVAPVLLLPAVLLLLARRWLPLSVGTVTALAAAIPFAVYEAQNHWQDYPNYRYYSSQHSLLDLDGLRSFMVIATGWQPPNDGLVPPVQRVLPVALVELGSVLETAMFLIGICIALAGIMQVGWRPDRVTRLRLGGLVLFVVLPIVLTIKHWQPLYPHYFFETYPAVFLLIGLACASTLIVPGSLARLARSAWLFALALVGCIQIASVIGALQYQTGAALDPCYSTPLGRVESVEQEVATFGHAYGSTRAVIELDAGDSKSMAYLLRSDFPDVDLPFNGGLSHIPTLVGPVGLGPTVAVSAPWKTSGGGPAVLTATRHLDLTYARDVTATDAEFSDQGRTDQNAFLAVTWRVEPDATLERPLAWQVALLNATGQRFAVQTGQIHIPSALRGQRLVSWFAIDARRDIAPRDLAAGPYHLDLQLVDTASPPTTVNAVDATGAPAASPSLPLTIAPLNRCTL